jgi:pimeloyl-ACP methyl ester carboxylesterase
MVGNTRRKRRSAAVAGALAAVALAAAGLILGPDAEAATNSFQRGPDPTVASIRAAAGPFAVTRTTVGAEAVTGFGGGDIYAPTDAGPFGAVAMVPGFTARRAGLAGLASRIATQGFVVFNIDTVRTTDSPAARGRQLLAALDFLTRDSAARDRIDPERLAVMGHSMGGGGSLQAALDRPDLQAVIPLAPFDVKRDFTGVTVPTMIIGAEDDRIAPVRLHAVRFFTDLPPAADRGYLELAGAGHSDPRTPDPAVASTSIAWLKRFVDDDTRFDQFLCPGPVADAQVSEYETNCPYS